jgi:transposase InsO family protein
VEILNILDDHSRVCIASVARRVTTAVQVKHTFLTAFDRWGVPAEVLTDNGAVFTAKQRGEGRVAVEVELGLRGVRISHSRPYHPQTCGKVERFQCATRRLVVSPVQPGWTRREVHGSDGLPSAERLTGTRACQETSGRV